MWQLCCCPSVGQGDSHLHNVFIWRFPRSKKAVWHKNIDAITITIKPSDIDFPWVDLRNHTNAYIKKTKKLTRENLDEHLRVLIQGHKKQEIAIAACAHALSPQSIMIVLGNVQNGVHPNQRRESYLQSLIAVNHVNSKAVSETDAMWARQLLLTSVSYESLEATVQRFARGLNRAIPLHGYVVDHTCRICEAFRVRLDFLKMDNQWISAYSLTSEWLAEVLKHYDSTSKSEIYSLLDTSFPLWRAWAGWRPSLVRLQLWEKYSLSHRAALKKFLALEGPDFLGYGRETMHDGLVAQNSDLSQAGPRYESICLEVRPNAPHDDQHLIDSLMRSVDATFLADGDYLKLFLSFFHGTPIKLASLIVLEELRSLGNVQLNSLTLQLHRAGDIASESVADGIKQSISCLESLQSQALHDFLRPYLVCQISTHLTKAEDKLRSQLQRSTQSEGLVKELLDFRGSVQKIKWLLPMLDCSLRTSINAKPALEKLSAIEALRTAAQKRPSKTAGPLIEGINDYYRALLVLRSCRYDYSKPLIPAMIQVWQQELDSNHRNLALSIAHYDRVNHELQTGCLAQLSDLPDKLVRPLQATLNDTGIEQITACIHCIEIFSSNPQLFVRPDRVLCWRYVVFLIAMRNRKDFLQYALEQGVDFWLQFLDSIRLAFDGQMGEILPALLKPSLQVWSQRVRSDGFVPRLQELWGTFGPGPVTRCLMIGPGSQADLAQLLEYLKASKGEHWQSIAEATLGLLRSDGSNAADLTRLLSFCFVGSIAGTKDLLHILRLSQNGAKDIATTFAAASLQDLTLNQLDRTAILQYADFLDLRLNLEGDDWRDRLHATANYLDDEFACLVAETHQLENLRVSLNATKPLEVSGLLRKLNIECPSVVDDMLSTLPLDLMDVVKKLDDHVVELQFPLIDHTKIQRRAFGANDVRSFLVRLVIPSEDFPGGGFCVHMHRSDEELIANDDQHSPWLCLEHHIAPGRPYCRGATRRGEYQLSRILWRHLHKGFTSLQDTYTLIASSIEQLGDQCIVCGSSRGGQRLTRSSICQSSMCLNIYSRAHLPTLISDLWDDPPVIEMLLSALTATVLADKYDLLKDSPFGNKKAALETLQQLPLMNEIREHADTYINQESGFPLVNKENSRTQSGVAPPQTWSINAAMATALAFYKPKERRADFPSAIRPTLIWACTKYGGFLVTASSQLRISMFPQSQQYVLVNASPCLEKTFLARYTQAQSKSRVLFHGTSLDRLYPILCQGLRICSGTHLQTYGASYGKGIYMAEEPRTAWAYAKNLPNAFGWRENATQICVLLGCEFTGNSTAVRADIHLITDPGRIIVRYIFLMKPEAVMPIKEHVVPAMQSAFASLRARTV